MNFHIPHPIFKKDHKVIPSQASKTQNLHFLSQIIHLKSTQEYSVNTKRNKQITPPKNIWETKKGGVRGGGERPPTTYSTSEVRL